MGDETKESMRMTQVEDYAEERKSGELMNLDKLPNSHVLKIIPEHYNETDVVDDTNLD